MNFQEAYQQAQATLAQQTQQGYLTGLATASYANYWTATTNANSTLTFSPQIVSYGNICQPAQAAAQPDDETAWLRRRVDEICWKTP